MGEDFAEGIRAQFSELHLFVYNMADTEAAFWPAAHERHGPPCP